MLLVARDFNLYLAAPEEPHHREDIAAVIRNTGLEDIFTHFLPHQK